MINRIWGSSNLLTASSQVSTGFVRTLSSINKKYKYEEYLNFLVKSEVKNEK